MPPRNWEIRIKDIRGAIRRNRKYLHNISYDEFKKDEKTIDAIVRNFIVIGEAAANIPSFVRKKFKEIPWNKMIGMRNFVVHEYFGVSIIVL
ncbi:MAG: HepT-like ribonuclease domain-containing protein [Candidatus Poribacteria bacterium]